MSETNPNNYEGSSATIVGKAGGEYEVKEFKNGGTQAQLSIAVGKGYKKDGEWVDTGTDWYTLTATTDYASDNWPNVQKGDKVRVDDARLELKPYTRTNGEAAVEATLRYGTLVIIEAKADRETAANKPF